eukprot:NODE_4331_length_813_cov_15.918848_g3588_i0.p5 GENE.NODE_4331_length_813_cov_15.918848_g3588_i0~~NODE_4331_length_813_cov_15.918848_g3588_i0.p5  ORF type:complete len:89 (-),score=6.22 NODE_4331_length_813_cov_15.918848_g3588_i0:44-310(-)
MQTILTEGQNGLHARHLHTGPSGLVLGFGQTPPGGAANRSSDRVSDLVHAGFSRPVGRRLRDFWPGQSDLSRAVFGGKPPKALRQGPA